MTDNEIHKWMRMAKSVTLLDRPCRSRDIGVVIVDPKMNSVISIGHNGPSRGVPPCDSTDYLGNVVWPLLTGDERTAVECDSAEKFTGRYGGCGQCPRKLVGAPSGARLELCTCVHGETDAIVSAGRSVAGCWMFCYCPVPCLDCAKLIVRSQISTVVALEAPQDYSPHSSRWLFDRSGVKLRLVDKDSL